MTANQILDNIRYQRAIERADRFSIVVIGKVYNKEHQFLGWAVKGNTKCCHLVTRKGSVLACDCQAGQAGSYCMHRAAVTRQMLEEGEPETAPTAPGTAAPIDSDLEEWTEREAVRSASLIMRNDGGPRIFR
jgi:hypothetical protein